MADDISQTLGFDVSSALDALTRLNSAFESFSSQLQSVAGNLSSFNSSAAQTVSVLKDIAGSAAAAASSLGRVTSAQVGGGSAASTLLTGQQAAAAMNSLLAQTGQNANAAAGAVSNLGNNSANNLNNATNSARGFAVSLETITRVITTQAIVRALSAIRDAVNEAFTGFLQFSNEISRLQTVAPTQSLQSLGDSVRKLSDEFNIPLADVAKANFTVIANGFKDSASSSEVLNEALKLSKLTFSDTNSAAQLLSTTLNAYGQSADQAGALSAKIFVAAQSGKLSVDDLSSAFGRAAQLGSQLGVSQDELLAALNTLTTTGGLRATEAVSELRSAMAALIKPSADAREALKSIGAESGVSAVAAHGLIGTIQALQATTDGSVAAITKLDPNMRALAGVFTLTGAGASRFQEELQRIQSVGTDITNTAYKVRMESNAEQVQKELNEIKNFLTVEIGQKLVSQFQSFVNLVGGVNTLKEALGALLPLVVEITGVLLAFAASKGIESIFARMAASTTQATSALAVFNAALGGLALGLAARQLGEFAGSKLTDALHAQADAADKIAQQQIDAHKAAIDRIAADDQKAIDAHVQAINQGIEADRRVYNEQVALAKTANEQLVQDEKTTLDSILTAFRSHEAEKRKAADDAQKDIINSQKSVAKLTGELADQQFNFANGRNSSLTQFFNDQKRAQELASTAAGLLAKAHSPDEKAAADDAFKRAEGYAKAAEAAAKSSGNVTAEFQAEKAVEAVIRAKIDAERQYQQLKAKDQQQAAASAAEAEKQTKEISAQAKIILENSNLFDKKTGDPLNDKQAQEHIKAATDAVAKIKDIVAKGGDVSLDKLLGLTTLQQRLNESVSKTQVSNLFATGSALENLHSQIQGFFSKAPISVQLAPDQTRFAGLTRNQQFDEAARQAKDQGNAVSTQSKGLGEIANQQSVVNAKLAEQNTLLHQTQNVGTTALQALNDSFDVLTLRFSTFDEAIRKNVGNLVALSKDPTATLANSGDKLKAVIENLQSIESKATGKGDNVAIENAAKEVQLTFQILEARQKIADLQKSGVNAGAFQQSQTGLEERARASRTETGATPGEATLEEIRNLGRSAAPAASAVDRLTPAAQSAAQALQSVQVNQAASDHALGGLIRGFSAGGLIEHMRYFGSGGSSFQKRGADTVPAMLSPGEFVVNADSSKKFYSQLVAMNSAHGKAAHFAGGGSVSNNVTIGDINVHSSSSTPTGTARDVGKAIRRELRRNTSTFLVP